MSKNAIVKSVLWGIVAVLVFVIISVMWFFGSLSEETARSSQVRFTIEKGWGVQKIAQELKTQGVISSEFLFVAGAKINGVSGILHEGEYIVPASVSINKLLDIFVENNPALSVSNDERWIEIPGEASNQKIAEYLEETANIPAEDFLVAAATTDPKDIFPGVTFPSLSDKPLTSGLEGYIYPDSHRIFKTATAKDIIFKALTEFETKLTQEDRDAITSQGKTIFEVLTLASIVEREEPNENERSKVAGVFLNRLKIGMALQSDATINYILDNIGEDRNAQPRTDQLKIDSPYNTYLYSGLPPGPISSPTIKSIRSVINYEDGDYYYFLHPQDGENKGETIYGRTLEEHNANKRKYL